MPNSPPGVPSGSPQSESPKQGNSEPPSGGAPDAGPPPPQPNVPPPIMVHIRTMMAGPNNEFTLAISPECTIGNLKHIIADRLDVAPERQLLSLEGKQLDDDTAVLPSYGVTSACHILMNIKLSTGTSTKASSDVILFVPNSFPSNNDALRNVIRGMTSRRAPRARRKEKPVDSSAQQRTPQKDMENAMTRNRMKSLIKTRRTRRQSLIDSGAINVESGSGAATPDHGSVIGSAENSVPATPPEWASSLSASSISSVSTTSLASSSRESVLEVTEKELKMFFDAPETRVELDATRCDLSVPPSSYEEYQQMKKDKELKEKTRCKVVYSVVCRSKLKLAEQSVVCACARAFCKKHRAPKEHHCPIDYKQTGRDKISKDNPKIYDGGKAKGKLG
ncbi:hypothetical protein PRIPAC_94597 [Pristionchus pacificus]|uniref:Ubiquitin n=1 Tax=Pristionchus pacificus TaxID=54126 RepID=A0A454XWJ2_PRIPA|nr:hypothetical protein PRIPAC_94597 [Pristionchus pacificus]|eukprot:PDM84944.1 Ubiquitin [Pristionchus pacificus]